MLQLMANISVDFALSNFYREIQCNSYKGAFRNQVSRVKHSIRSVEI